MRLVGWNVQPVVLADDGERLTPVQVQAAQVMAAEWDSFKNGGDDQALARVRDQIENPAGQQDARDPAG
jgi:hypothetical protein